MTVWDDWARGLDAQRGRLEKRLHRAKLDQRASAILDLCRVSAGMRLPLLKKKPAPIGTSRSGGLPDLPADTEWPSGYSFVMQVNLADLAGIPLATPLPKKGLLSFFIIDGENDEYEYLSEGKVIYSTNAEPTSLFRQPKQKGVSVYPARGVELVPFLSLPQSNSLAIQKAKLTDDERERYADDVFRKTTEPRYRIGGHDSDYYAPAGVKAQLLLLSLSSSDAASFFWGDADRLQFYLPEADWKKSRFAGAEARCATA